MVIHFTSTGYKWDATKLLSRLRTYNKVPTNCMLTDILNYNINNIHTRKLVSVKYVSKCKVCQYVFQSLTRYKTRLLKCKLQRVVK